MAVLSSRIAKLEDRLGTNDSERWLNLLSEEDLDRRIEELTEKIRFELRGRGIECDGLTADELLALANQLPSESR